MPITAKRRGAGRDPPTEEQPEQARADNPDEEAATFTRFLYRPNWFVISQTDGKPYELPARIAWQKDLALAALHINEIPFTALSGNIQGYAQQRSLAINPIAALPHKTLFHELGHIELGHTQKKDFAETDNLPRHLQEAEAEGVALLCLDTLNLPGAEYSRGYIQNWLAGDKIVETSAQRIFGAADRILKAGRGE
jgi:hypothetical protein